MFETIKSTRLQSSPKLPHLRKLAPHPFSARAELVEAPPLFLRPRAQARRKEGPFDKLKTSGYELAGDILKVSANLVVCPQNYFAKIIACRKVKRTRAAKWDLNIYP